MNVDSPNPGHFSDRVVQPSERKKRHLAGIAFGFLFPLLLLGFALGRHVTNYILFIAASFPVIFLGFRSWRRWFYPDRLPIRWVEDSVAYKLLRLAEWGTAVVNLVAWLAVGLMTSAQGTSHHKTGPVWLAAMLSASIRVILMQYREDRKPLTPTVPLPSVSPYDPSLRLTNPIRPVYSKDWDNY